MTTKEGPAQSYTGQPEASTSLQDSTPCLHGKEAAKLAAEQALRQCRPPPMPSAPLTATCSGRGCGCASPLLPGMPGRPGTAPCRRAAGGSPPPAPAFGKPKRRNIGTMGREPGSDQSGVAVAMVGHQQTGPVAMRCKQAAGAPPHPGSRTCACCSASWTMLRAPLRCAATSVCSEQGGQPEQRLVGDRNLGELSRSFPVQPTCALPYLELPAKLPSQHKCAPAGAAPRAVLPQPQGPPAWCSAASPAGRRQSADRKQRGMLRLPPNHLAHFSSPQGAEQCMLGASACTLHRHSSWTEASGPRAPAHLAVAQQRQALLRHS